MYRSEIKQNILETNVYATFLGQICGSIDAMINPTELFVQQNGEYLNVTKLFQIRHAWLILPQEKVVDSEMNKCINLALLNSNNLRRDYLLPQNYVQHFLEGYKEVIQILGLTCVYRKFPPPANDVPFSPPSF